MVFKNRSEAGKILAGFLTKYAKRSDTVVLALPRGGVPVAYPIAKALGVPLDTFVVRKLGVPGHEELAMGAVATGGIRYLNQDVIDYLRVDESTVDAITAREEMEVMRRDRLYRGERPPLSVRGKVVILVDDGLATGSTMRAAILALRHHAPARIVVAVPAGAPETCREMSNVSDEIICAIAPKSFAAVGQCYEEFSQTTDNEVHQLLAQARRTGVNASSGRTTGPASEPASLSIPVNGQIIQADLRVVDHQKGTVIFAHGSGSSRHSPRNKYVADVLHLSGLGTLLVDLLTPEEESVDRRTLEHRFDIDTLANRLTRATEWLAGQSGLSTLPVGYFGASTGAAAALVAAAKHPGHIGAIVSRGGRPDLARNALKNVTAPTLLIVGERDPEVLELNRRAAMAMPGQTEMEIVAGATHLFEEPGALERVAWLAREWFEKQLIRKQAA